MPVAPREGVKTPRGWEYRLCLRVSSVPFPCSTSGEGACGKPGKGARPSPKEATGEWKARYGAGFTRHHPSGSFSLHLCLLLFSSAQTLHRNNCMPHMFSKPFLLVFTTKGSKKRVHALGFLIICALPNSLHDFSFKCTSATTLRGF